MNDVIEIESIPTKIKYKGIIWIPIGSEKVNHSKGNVKKSYLVKWIDEKKRFGDVFTLDEFYAEFPKHKKDKGCRDRLVRAISNLIKEEKIRQGNNKDEFKVIK